jgi:uncharacterized delta-60 repeat protein
VAFPGCPNAIFRVGTIVPAPAFRVRRRNHPVASTIVRVRGDGKIVVVGQTTNASGFEDFALARYNTDGSLDTTFGTGGLVVTDFGEVLFEHAVAVTIQSDGRIVAAGRANFSIAVARYLADGSLDASFDGDGLVLTSVGGPSFSLSGMALHANGRIVVTGSLPTPGGVLDDFAVVRFKTDGSLDTSLGGAGIVTTDFSGGFDIPTAVAIQEDGKIVVSGFIVDLAVFDTRFAVARFNEDGSLDAAFGSAGKVTTDVEGTLDLGSALALQADGKIVVVGSTGAGAASRDIAVARYDTDGTLDPTFGIGGTVTTDIVGAVDFGFAVAIQADGRIVVAARMDLGPAKGGSDFGLVRYEGPAPHELTLFLHGFDVPGTTGGFTMNLTPPAPHLFASQTNAVSWFSEPIVNGAFLTGAAFQITLPCTGGVAQAMTVRLSTADAAGRSEQVLGEVMSAKKPCQSQTIRMPVTTPATFAQRRLKLTFTSTLPVLPPLHLGPQTFVSATRFVGAP